MHPSLSRAQLLLQHSRYDLAEQELRRHLAGTPHDPYAHALLGLALLRQEKLDEGQAEVEQAIGLAPDEPYPHYCRSVVLEHRRRFAEAEAAAREAIRLDASDADYRAQLAATLFAQEKWQAALDAALAGLALNADHAGCQHLRTMALTKLGRRQEALASVDEALARRPDDAYSHTNKGWTLLHQREPRQALEHFREALRLDPTLEYARAGTIEALKARNPIYRWMLSYFLWMGRLSPRARWGVILGGYFGYRVLSNVADDQPALAPWLTPLMFAYVGFVLLTWFSVPLFNLLLRLNPFGRYALSRDQRTASNWFGACVLLFAGCLAAWLLADIDAALIGALIAAGLALPLVTIFSCDRGWPRQSMTLYAAGMAALGAVVLVGVGLEKEWTFQLLNLFAIGFMVTPLVANYLMTATAAR